MKIAMTGSSGFLGTALRARLAERGHTVTRLVRRQPTAADEISWDPAAGTIDAPGLEGHDVVVHLAGESIGDGRWTASRKRRIRESRTAGTGLLARTLADLERPPAVLVSQSGAHYYGDRGAEALTEDSGPGTGFLAEVVRAWEAAADPAREAGIRVVHPRTGLPLSPAGGLLPRMLTPFKLGAGARFGSGQQYLPWISLDDQLGLYEHVLARDDLDGPVNFANPNPVTNAEFTRTLGRVLRRPAVLAVPRFAPAIVFGRELVEELLFASLRVLPERALTSGYAFHHTHLETCLRELLDRPE
jgi:uncharacterized protein